MEIYKNGFNQKFEQFINKNKWLRFKLAFIDCGTEKVLQSTLPQIWSRLVKGGILILDHYNSPASPMESSILEKHIGKNKIKQLSFVRQPTAYVIKKRLNFMIEFAKKLWPINRSLTGSGVALTLSLIQQKLPIKILNFNSGKKVFDWQIPKVWNLKEAWVKNKNNKKIIDFRSNNLHIVGYSQSVDKIISLNELKKKFTL